MVPGCGDGNERQCLYCTWRPSRREGRRQASPIRRRACCIGPPMPVRPLPASPLPLLHQVFHVCGRGLAKAQGGEAAGVVPGPCCSRLRRHNNSHRPARPSGAGLGAALTQQTPFSGGHGGLQRHSGSSNKSRRATLCRDPKVFNLEARAVTGARKTFRSVAQQRWRRCCPSRGQRLAQGPLSLCQLQQGSDAQAFYQP